MWSTDSSAQLINFVVELMRARQMKNYFNNVALTELCWVMLCGSSLRVFMA